MSRTLTSHTLSVGAALSLFLMDPFMDIFTLVNQGSNKPMEAYLTAGCCRGNNPWGCEYG